MSAIARVLVTGGAGFIGSHIADRYASSGAHVTVLDDMSQGRPENLSGKIAVREGDIADPASVALMAAESPDLVVHCAAQASVPRSFENPGRDASVNLVGTLHAFEAACRARSRRFVYVTTGGALFGGEMTHPWTEEDEVHPLSPYGLSKWAGERYLEVLRRDDAPPVSVLRLANVYGPRQGGGGEGAVVAAFVERMLAGSPVRIDGDGEQTRDLIFVGDVVDAVEAAAGGPSGTYHIGTGRGTSVNELFAVVAELLGYGRAPEHGPARHGDIRASALDPSRAARLLDWRPRTSLRDGLVATIAAVRESN